MAILITFSLTFIAMEHTSKSLISTDRKTSEKTVHSSASVKPNGKSIATSATVMKPNEKAAVSSANPMNPEAANALSPPPCRPSDACNPNTKTLIGQEMLLIDEEGTVIQGFVPAGRVGIFDLVAGSVYNLSNFFGSRSKEQYRVADHVATVSFSWNSSLSVLENPPVLIPDDRFRFHSYEEFRANCDSRGDLYGICIDISVLQRVGCNSHCPRLEWIAHPPTKPHRLHVNKSSPASFSAVFSRK
ncbi:hypothetical protein HID58_021032 [Brassica napus]|uniref:Uncharacterized protein n=1 Tax=Brassica napus TaxID=3708 RepID=A0ABQ8CVA6_BRANA|nr:hypothetical protein HID58_021032 [Brassica napus]